MSATRPFSSVVLAVALGCGAATAGATTLKVEHRQSGLRVLADDARLEEVLEALAEAEHFDLVIQLGVERRPVNVDLRDVTLEEALRRVLRRRSYAISYAETDDGLAVSRVSVLLPAAALEQGPASRRSPAVVAAEYQRRLAQQRDQAEQRRLARQQAERARQRRLWVERAREAQRRREAALQAAAEPAPLRRLLWGRSR